MSRKTTELKEPDHNGTFVGLWLSDELYLKLNDLSRMSGKNRSDTIRTLIEQRPLPNKSFVKTLNLVAKIGGLMKSKVDAGERGKAYKLGERICEIVQAIRDSQRE